MTWTDLRELRSQGLRPRLRVFVTTDPGFARRMEWVGAAAIVHEAGEPMPVELLDGLDVILDVGNCQRAAKVHALLLEREVKPARLQAWCHCAGGLTAVVDPTCKVDHAWAA